MGIGMESIDMPFTKYGIRPDIIMNPNAIPSRMTIGQLWECLLGKIGALKGMNMDGTAFEDYDLNKMKNILEQLGYQRECEEYLYNGMTGKMIKHMIFIGPTYYQRLKHMVQDKVHCLTKNHQVLTNSGWIDIDQITKNHLIKVSADNNQDTCYASPIDVYQFDKTPKRIITIFYPDGRIMQEITDEHRVYVVSGKNSVFQLIKISELMTDMNTLDCISMMNGNGLVINGPFKYKVDIRNDPVYCMSVPNERFVVRYNNHISDINITNDGIWTGNSRARGPVTILTRQAPEGFGSLCHFFKEVAGRRV